MEKNNKVFRVRFHLQAGENFEKWQVKDELDNIKFYDPKEVTLIMENCTLKNRRKVAQKIYKGANKTVCAWVQCTRVTPVKPRYDELGIIVHYSPREHPFWETRGKCLDNKDFGVLITEGKFVKALLPKHIRDQHEERKADSTIIQQGEVIR